VIRCPIGALPRQTVTPTGAASRYLNSGGHAHHVRGAETVLTQARRPTNVFACQRCGSMFVDSPATLG